VVDERRAGNQGKKKMRKKRERESKAEGVTEKIEVYHW